MSSESYSETHGNTCPQFALQGQEAVCTGDGYTVTASNWSLGKEAGLIAILSFRNGATDPIKDRVKFGLESSRQKFIGKLPEAYRTDFESVIFAFEDFLKLSDAKERAPRSEGEVRWQIAVDRGSEFLGWFDSDWLYLLPDPASKAVNQFCRDAEEPFAVNQDRLRRDLAEEDICKIDTGGKTASVRFGGGAKRVLQLNIAKLEKLTDEKLVTTVTGVTGNSSRGTTKSARQ
jgi:hypothetical protein